MDHEELRRRPPARWLNKLVTWHLPLIKPILSGPRVLLLAVVLQDNSAKRDTPVKVSVSRRFNLAYLLLEFTPLSPALAIKRRSPIVVRGLQCNLVPARD